MNATKLYKSRIGEVKSYGQWKLWAEKFFKDLNEPTFVRCPGDWFKRVEKILKLEEVI